MKHNISRTGLLLILTVVWTVNIAARAQAEQGSGGKRAADGNGGPCSLHRAAGNWSLTDQGTVIGVGPRVAVGVFSFDAAGNLLNGLATSSLNGSIADETFSGAYTVNPNCTGTLSANIYDASSGALLLTVAENLAFDQEWRPHASDLHLGGGACGLRMSASL